MRRIIVALPGLVGEPDGVSWLREARMSNLFQSAKICRLAPMPDRGLPEAAILGVAPSAIDLAQGPLTVSALEADPPPKSVHFHMTLMSLDVAGNLHALTHGLTLDERKVIREVAGRLGTKRLTTLIGEGEDHGIVWEDGSIEMKCHSPTESMGKSLQGVLPEGDGEVMLRRYIDDSVNILMNHEMNRRRIDEEREPVSVCWPWGQGFREQVPNLALRRGQFAWVETDSFRLRGLARLAGEKVVDTKAFGSGLEINFRSLASSSQNRALTVIYTERFDRIRKANRDEEGVWLTRKLVDDFLNVLDLEDLKNPLALTLVAPGNGEGLALGIETKMINNRQLPFDERVLCDRTVPIRNAWEVIREAMN